MGVHTITIVLIFLHYVRRWHHVLVVLANDITVHVVPGHNVDFVSVAGPGQTKADPQWWDPHNLEKARWRIKI